MDRRRGGELHRAPTATSTPPTRSSDADITDSEPRSGVSDGLLLSASSTPSCPSSWSARASATASASDIAGGRSAWSREGGRRAGGRSPATASQHSSVVTAEARATYFRLRPGVSQHRRLLPHQRRPRDRGRSTSRSAATKRLSNRWMMRGNLRWNDSPRWTCRNSYLGPQRVNPTLVGGITNGDGGIGNGNVDGGIIARAVGRLGQQGRHLAQHRVVGQRQRPLPGGSRPALGLQRRRPT